MKASSISRLALILGALPLAWAFMQVPGCGDSNDDQPNPKYVDDEGKCDDQCKTLVDGSGGDLGAGAILDDQGECDDRCCAAIGLGDDCTEGGGGVTPPVPVDDQGECDDQCCAALGLGDDCTENQGPGNGGIILDDEGECDDRCCTSLGLGDDCFEGSGGDRDDNN